MSIFSNVITGLTAPQLLIGKVIASVLLIIALYGAWHSFTGHYVGIGREQVQQEWEAQKLIDEEARNKDLARTREKEILNAEANANTDKKLLEDKLNENKALNAQLNAIRADNRRLRTITGTTIRQGEISSSTSSSDATCAAQLPREIDEGFRRLQLESVRISSEADNTARQLAAAQEIIKNDRLTCNGE